MVPLARRVAAVVLDEVDAQDAPRTVELRDDDEEERRPEVADEERARQPEGEDELARVLPPELGPPVEARPALHAGEGVGAGDVGEVDEVQEVPPEADVLGRGPVGLAVVVEVVVHEVVRGDVRRDGEERAEAEDAPKEHVEPLALEDALVQVVVDDHRVEEAEVAGRPEEQRCCGTRARRTSPRAGRSRSPTMPSCRTSAAFFTGVVLAKPGFLSQCETVGGTGKPPRTRRAAKKNVLWCDGRLFEGRRGVPFIPETAPIPAVQEEPSILPPLRRVLSPAVASRCRRDGGGRVSRPARWVRLEAVALRRSGYPRLLYFLICAHLWIHNATHGNFPKWLNRLIGEVLGVIVFVRYASWDIVHMRHHRFSDDSGKDPHPTYPSYWKSFFSSIVYVEKQLQQQYCDVWGDTTENRRYEAFRAKVSYGTNIVLAVAWYLVPRAAWRSSLLLPLNLIAAAFVGHFNWSTHNGGARAQTSAP